MTPVSTLVLALVIGAVLGSAFVGGCLVGAWIQREIGFVIKMREQAKLKAAQSRVVPEIQTNAKGSEHPSGPPPPTPAALRRRDPTDWMDDVTKDSGARISDIAKGRK